MWHVTCCAVSMFPPQPPQMLFSGTGYWGLKQFTAYSTAIEWEMDNGSADSRPMAWIGNAQVVKVPGPVGESTKLRVIFTDTSFIDFDLGSQSLDAQRAIVPWIGHGT